MSRFKHKRTKDNKRLKLIIGIGAIFLMVTSIAGLLSNQNSDSQFVYGDYSFAQQPSGYVTKVDGQQISFFANPFEVEKYLIDSGSLDIIRNSQVAYVTFDTRIPDPAYMDLLRFELANQLQEYANTIAIPAVAEFNKTYPLPVISCDNATETVPVIYFERGSETKITQQDNCLVLSAPSAQIHLLLKDRLIYGLVGIIE